MKTTIKVIILILAVVAAIGGVMIFAKTRVEPPTAIKNVDQYAAALEKAAAPVASTSEIDTLEKGLHFTDVLLSEGKIDARLADRSYDRLVDAFVPGFVAYCNNKFNASVWNAADHTQMLATCGRLHALRHTDDTNVLRTSASDSIAFVVGTISSYREARALCRASFKSLSQARTDIARANELAEFDYLKNCTDLVASLNNVSSRLENAHYNHLAALVRRLSNYSSFSSEYDFDQYVESVEAKLREYDSDAASVYGTKRDTDGLWSNARDYYSNAYNYFNY